MWVLIYFQTQLHQEESDWNLVDFYIWRELFHYVGSYCWQRAKQNALSGDSFLCMFGTHYTIHANYAKNVILCSICPGTHIGDHVGDCSWCPHVDDANTLPVKCANILPVKREMPVWVTQPVTSSSFTQCETSLGVPIICLACWSTRNRRAASPHGVLSRLLCKSNTAEACPRSPCAHEAPIEYLWPILLVG